MPWSAWFTFHYSIIGIIPHLAALLIFSSISFVSKRKTYQPLRRFCFFIQSCAWASCQIRHIAGCACAGNAENFSQPPRVSDLDMHHGTWVTHMPRCMPGSLTSGFLWSRWRGKRSRYSRCMWKPQFYVSSKRSMACFPLCGRGSHWDRTVG